MKKIIIFLIVLFIFNIDNNNTSLVFDETIEYTNFYEITFINNVSTNNFLDYFDNIKVIWIKPKINILYKNKLSKFNKYYFKSISNLKNINKFNTDYINYINQLGYKNEALKLKTSGIMLDKIKVYLNKEDLYYITNNLIDIKIENVG